MLPLNTNLFHFNYYRKTIQYKEIMSQILDIYKLVANHLAKSNF